MAFGNQDNNEKKNYEPRVYSPYKTSNVDGIDPSSLGVTFFRNLLQLSISPKLQNTGDKIAFDHDNAIVVYLTHTKARILKNEVERVLEINKSHITQCCKGNRKSSGGFIWRYAED